MAEKRRCSAEVSNPKSPNYGQRCRLYARRGSAYCGKHGENHTSGPGHPETLEHRCIARNRFNEQCRQPAMRGSTVCGAHGGRRKATRAKAQRRLLAAVDPVLSALFEVAMRPGTSDSDRLRAIAMVLDRAGFGTTSQLEIEVQLKPWEKVMNHIVKEIPADYEVPAVPTSPVRGEYIEDAVIVEDTLEARHRARDLLPQIIPPSSSNQRATVRKVESADERRERRDAKLNEQFD